MQSGALPAPCEAAGHVPLATPPSGLWSDSVFKRYRGRARSRERERETDREREGERKRFAFCIGQDMC